jgi:hypothetical protein
MEPLSVSICFEVSAILAPARAVPPLAKYVPAFRFALFNGATVVTEPVGRGPGWASLGAAAPKAPDANAAPLLVQHRTQLDGLTGDLALARSIAASPILHVFLGLRLAEGAAGAGERPWGALLPLDLSPLLANAGAVTVTYGSVAAAQAAVTRPDGASVDLASLLAAGSLHAPALPCEAACLPPPALFSFLHVSVRVVSATQRVPPPPPSATELAEKAAAAAAAAASPAASKGKAAPAPAKGGKGEVAAAPADGLIPSPVLPPRLWSALVLQAINPLALTLHRADGMPGIALPEGVDELEKEWVNPSPHTLLRDNCAPVYALLRLPGPGVAPPAGCAGAFVLPPPPSVAGGGGGGEEAAVGARRIAFPHPTLSLTPGRPQESRIAFGGAKWGDVGVALADKAGPSNPYAPPLPPCLYDGTAAGWPTAVLPLGLLPPGSIALLRDALLSGAAVVEVHDRDCGEYEERVQRGGGSAAALRARTEAVSAAPAPLAPPPTLASPIKGGKTSAAAAAPVAVEAPLTAAALQAALLPRDWAWPALVLPPAVIEQYEAIAAGKAPWPAWDGEGTGPAAKGLPGLDAIVAAEAVSLALSARDRHAHAVARVRLEGLLDRGGERARMLEAGRGGALPVDSRSMNMPSAAAVEAAGLPPLAPLPPLPPAPLSITLPLSAPLTAAPRAVRPALPEPTHLLSPAQRRAIGVGAYGSTGARLKMTVTLAHGPGLHTEALTRTPAPESPPFERAVLSFDYTDDSTLHVVLDTIAAVNTTALAHVDSHSSYALTPAEVVAAESGSLDILTGLHLTDGPGTRLIVVEGVGGEGHGMAALRAALPRPDLNGPAWSLLSNPHLRFSTRLYTPFGLALKELHLRRPLAVLADEPSVYRVPAGAALTALVTLRHSPTLTQALQLGADAWPSARGLADLERCYGGAVSLADAFGQSHPAAAALQETAAQRVQAEQLVAGHVAAAMRHDLLLTVTMNLPQMSEEEKAAMQAEEEEEAQRAAANARHAARYSRGSTATPAGAADVAAYAAALAAAETARLTRDYVATNVHAVGAASTRLAAGKRTAAFESLSASMGPLAASAALEARAQGRTLDSLDADLPGGQVFPYSGQKLNTGAWAAELQRQRLAKDKTAAFARTLSMEAGSLSLGISTAPPEALASWPPDKDGPASRAQWKTAAGWTTGDHATVLQDVARGVDPKRPSELRSAVLNAAWEDPGDLPAVNIAKERAHAAGPGRPAMLVHPTPAPLSRSQRGLFGYVAPDTGRLDWLSLEASVHLAADGPTETKARNAALKAKAEWTARVIVDTTVARPYHSGDGAGRVFRYGSLLAGGESLPPSALAEPFKGPPDGLSSTLRAAGGDGPRSFNGRVPKPASLFRPAVAASYRPDHDPGKVPSLHTMRHGINTDTKHF